MTYSFNSINRFLIPSFFGLILGFGCVYPDNYLTPTLVFIAICFLYFYNYKIRSSEMFYVGFVFHLVSMWWLAPTLEKFGDMPSIASFLLMILHSFLSSFQFVLVICLTKRLEGKVGFYLSFPLLWLLSELFFPRLFPWSIANYFISLPWLTSYAQIFGVFGVSFIILAIAGFFTYSFSSHKKILKYTFAAFIIIFAIFGVRLSNLSNDPKDKISAVVVQGNLGLDEKGYEQHYEANISKYVNLTNDALEKNLNKDNTFIVWPESVVSQWHNFNNLNYNQEIMDPYPEASVPMLYGGLGYRKSGRETMIYNGAILRNVDGQIGGVTAKKILMPFGEYVPFANIIPWIRDFTPIKKDFSVGNFDEPLELKLNNQNYIKLGVNICYEDLSSSLSRDQVFRGSEVLVNLTNDAWYGDSAAPFQHNLLARFRAIETHRYLIRSTNTGFTTLINPRGEIEVSLPLFKEAVSIMDFYPKDDKTIYVKYGNLTILFLGLVYAVIALLVSSIEF